MATRRNCTNDGLAQRSKIITIRSRVHFLRKSLIFSRFCSFQGSKIGPGTYNIKSSIDQFVNKRTGTKGPYQIFTIDRSAPINTGHYTILDSWDLSPDFPSKDFPDSISLARQLEKNPKQGEFSKLARFEKKPSNRLAIEYPGLEPKNVDFPGPGAHAITRPWESADFHAKKFPFNSTSSRNDKRSFTHAGVHHVRTLLCLKKNLSIVLLNFVVSRCRSI